MFNYPLECAFKVQKGTPFEAAAPLAFTKWTTAKH